MKAKLYNRISVKLIFLTSFIIIIILAIHTYLRVNIFTEEIESIYRQNADNISNLIKQSTRYSMLLNRCDDVDQIIKKVGTEPFVKKIRIYNKDGHIKHSTDTTEFMKKADLNDKACAGCHGQIELTDKIPDKYRIRTINVSKDERVLFLFTPIMSAPDCYNADCHAHHKTKKVLGVQTITFSLNEADEIIAVNTKDIIYSGLFLIITISLVSGLFIFILVNRPLKRLGKGIKEVGKGNLEYKINLKSKDELGIIAHQFDSMSEKLSLASKEIMDWSETLNEKVKDKTAELKKIYDQMIQFEKLASLGKLSATVAHELNNPLAGILTYSKLISKKLKESNDKNIYSKEIEYLDLIADEANRCGKIVKDLLTFSHVDHEEFSKNDLIKIIDKSIKLIRHHLEINNIELKKDFSVKGFLIKCNPQKIQQALISLLINAVESMFQQKGTLTIKLTLEGKFVIIKIIDQGMGIPPVDLPYIFEPFYSTKDKKRGTGLGLSVVYGIIILHEGNIEVESTSSQGTVFKITLPINLNNHK